MFSDYYYNETIKKTIAVFGTLFNNISVGRKSGTTLSNFQKVPIVHGPRQKFLDRIRERPEDALNDAVAIKLPRISFEVTSVSYDTTVKLNKFNSILTGSREDGKVGVLREGTPYLLNLQLTVMARNYDDALQIVEQILPMFAPNYTVTVKDFDGPGSRVDLPFTLLGVSPDNQYEGDLENSRSTFMWNLDFSVKVKFVGGVSKASVIESVDLVNIYDRLRDDEPKSDPAATIHIDSNGSVTIT
jgi:hypothetical protein